METDCVILEKRPCQESALLVRALSPDAGRLDLMAHGAQKISGSSFPVVDLFQELAVEYSMSEKSQLGNLKSAELKEDFSAVSGQPKHLIFAGRIARFLLDNTQPDIPLPLTFDTLVNVLRHLSAAPGGAGVWSMMQCAVLFKAAFLYENGLLPEVDGTKGEFLEQLMDAGINNDPLPECSQAYWRTLNGWLNSLIEYHQLKKRKEPGA